MNVKRITQRIMGLNLFLHVKNNPTSSHIVPFL